MKKFGGDNLNIGQIIRDARIKKGYTQEQLGEIMGVQKSAIAKWENGRVVNIKRENLKKLAEVLSIPPYELVAPNYIVNDSAQNLSDDEVHLLDMYRQLNDQGKEYVLQTVTMATHVYTKKDSVSNVENSAG